jgi:DNA-binding NarL/FixJ family response regulator
MEKCTTVVPRKGDMFCYPMLRVVVADENFIVREGLREILTSQPEVDVVAMCDDLEGLLAAAAERSPDVVVTGIRMPPTNTDEGIRAATTLRDSHPQVGVVVLSQYLEPGYVLGLLESGSKGRAYLLKERVHDASDLVTAIEAVADGGSVIDPKVVEVLVTARARGDGSPLGDLTAAESRVLAEIAQGKSNVAIAESLQLSKRAVEKHAHSIFTKLGLASSPEVSKRVKAALLFLAESPAPPA